MRDGQELLCLGDQLGRVDAEALRELVQSLLVVGAQAARALAAAARGVQAEHIECRKQIVLRKLSFKELLGDLHSAHHPSQSLHDIGWSAPAWEPIALRAGDCLGELQCNLSVATSQAHLVQEQTVDAFLELLKLDVYDTDVESVSVHEPGQQRALIAGISHHAQQDHALVCGALGAAPAPLPHPLKWPRTLEPPRGNSSEELPS